MNLISELDPSRQMAFNADHLLSLNPRLRHRYAHSRTNEKPAIQSERCTRFLFDSQIDKRLLDRTVVDSPARWRQQ